MPEIYLAGGCFWGLEKYVRSISGVLSAEVGYANGSSENPSYEDVCYGGTGHAEAVKVEYDPETLPLGFLLELYFDAIDPTSVNRQGGDRGVQYRSGIYYTDPGDLPVIERAIKSLQKRFDRPIAVEVGPLVNYSPAEEHHQRYLDKNPGGYCHIGPGHFKKAASARIAPGRYTPPDRDRLRDKLTETQYAVTQDDATEPPFQNEFWNHDEEGIYVDVTTGEPLFSSGDKFDAGCGWPSFTRPIDPFTVGEKADLSRGRVRTEVRSRVGDAHLGHVFDDGPRESGGLRYCINSAALRFVSRRDMEKEGYGYLLHIFN